MRARVIAAIAVLMPFAAFAESTSYQFTGQFNAEFPDPGGIAFIPPDIFDPATTLQGAFTYDPAVGVLSSTPLDCCTGTFQIYDAPIAGFSVDVDGHSASTDAMFAAVGDDILIGGNDPADLMFFFPFPLDNLTGFSVDDWSLVSMSLAFDDLKAITGGTALDGGLLPVELLLGEYVFSGINLVFQNGGTGERRVSQFTFTRLVGTPNTVPEPGTLLLLCSGLLAISLRRASRSRRRLENRLA